MPDPAHPTPTTTFTWSGRHVLALVVLCLAALLDTLDVTVVNVAMPAIQNTLHFSESGLAWMVNAYMVPFGGFLLLAGRAGDLIGRRRLLLAGTALFTVASLASALAPNVGVMVATRAVEGLAAAFVVPTTLAMLATAFPTGPARNLAFAVWGGASAVAGTLGLIAGGLLVAAVGWRWIFLVNLPVGALILAAAVRVLPGDRPTGDRRPFDAVGAGCVTAGMSLLAYAVLQTSTHPWGSGRTITLLAGAVVLLGYFLVHERFVAVDPLMPLPLWRNRSLAGANLASALQSSAIFAMFYSTTLYQQQVLGYSALRTGVAYVPFGLSILTAAALGPVLVQRTGVRSTMAAGSLVAAAGLILLTALPVSGSLLTNLLLPEMVIGLGAGLMFIPASVAALAGIPTGGTGVASALLTVSRQLGGALGLAVIATIVTARTTVHLATGQTPAIALTSGFQAGFAVSAALMIASAVASVVLLREDGRGARVDLVELQAAST